jgi:putative redox protein
MKATLHWERELIFVGRTNRGYEIEFDAQIQWGCAPTEALLLALAGCTAIDVVSFLRKMKVQLQDFKIDIIGERNPTPPQYFKRIELVLSITGKGLEERKVRRAVELSHEKYCSVYHSLRKDLQVKIDYVLNEVP